MLPLEEEIVTLAAYDRIRADARDLLDAGLRGLAGSSFDVHERWDAPRVEYAHIENAVLLRAVRMGRNRGRVPSDANVAALERDTLAFLSSITARSFTLGETGTAPTLTAARTLEALARVPGHVVSNASATCLYWILRELYASEPPAWTLGAARAGEGCRATAFVTVGCSRAILDVCRSLMRGGQLCSKLDTAHARRDKVTSIPRIPAAWRAVELERLHKTLEVDTLWLRARTIFLLDDLEGLHLENTSSRLAAQLDVMSAAVELALREIRVVRAGEATDRAASESAHQTALRAVDALGNGLRQAASSLRTGDWAATGKRLQQLAHDLNELLEPSRNFIGGVLDHQLAASAAQRSDRDLPELAFSAAAFGLLHNAWDDPRLGRAAEVLAAAVTEGGRLPTGSPYQSRPNGYQLHPVGAEVGRALAVVFRHAHHVITPALVASLLRLFRDTQREVPGGIGWSAEAAADSKKASWASSARSLIALDEVVRLLDTYINERVAAHFSVTHAARLKVDLDQAFYPDFGLVRPGRPSVALQLQRMRAHLLGISRVDFRDPLSSLVLYGPPGTGKTTLAEALARTAGVRLVHVTPSDIVLGGAELAEYRARVVFQALAMLTDTVVLFDEFDSLLRRRSEAGKVPTTIFELLTPGMLPKLERLHDASRNQRLAYILATNLVGSLDPAAIRDGRFDEKVGVYPPDLVSRLGRLLFVKPVHTPDAERRLIEVCAQTHDSPMSTLGRPGWFSAEDHPKDGSGQAYIDDPTTVPIWPQPEFIEIQPSGQGKHAHLELAEWLWNRASDWRIVDGSEPGGDLFAYLRTHTWNALRAKLRDRSLGWDDVTVALAPRIEWEPFFDWLMSELRRLNAAGTTESWPPPAPDTVSSLAT